MDKIDLQILDTLQGDARITNVALAEAVNLSPAPCLRRVRDLEGGGVIRGYSTVLDADKLGWGVSMFIEIRLERQVADGLEVFERTIASYPEVMECYLMTGSFDYLLRVVARDLNSLQEFMTDKLATLPGIANMKSGVALKQVKYKTALPILDG